MEQHAARSRTARWLCLLAGVGIFLSSSSLPQAHTAKEPRFRLAILGVVHSHAWGHLREIAKMPGVELVGIADPRADLREAAAKEAPGVTLYTDYAKLLDEKKPEGCLGLRRE